MTTADDKKPIEDKKYAQLTRESIRIYAESSSGSYSDLNDGVVAMIAEDTNYRIREVIHNSGQFMRHARRKKLSSEDINKALHWSDVEPLYGYSSCDPISTVYVKEAEVFYPEENESNLLNLIITPNTFHCPLQPQLNSQWLAIEGVLKSDSGSPQSKKNGHVTTVSEDLMVYYDHVTKVILSNNEKLLKLALDDLSSNAKIAPLLPYLVNFVSVGVKKMSHDLTQLTKLLHTIRSLVSNPSLYLGLEPYLSLLLQAVLYCILEPLAASINPINDHWTLRDSAAQLLSKIIKEWSTPVNNLLHLTLCGLKELFIDLSKPFCSHYGAVVAILAFGIEATEKVLYPYLSYYWPHLMLAFNDCSYSSAQIKADAQKVYGVLLLVAELLIRSRQKAELLSPSETNDQQEVKSQHNGKFEGAYKKELTDNIKKEYGSIFSSKEHSKNNRNVKQPTCLMYAEFYDFFGDALAVRLPSVHVTGLYVPKQYPTVELFSAPELLQTGEELLETFYEKDEELKSNSIEDDNSYDDRDDISVLSDEHETDPVDLQIKSTVSDPNLGIKLTIAKLRRTKPPEEPKPVKRKKLTIKTSKEMWDAEPVFEFVPPISNYHFIDFSFEGASPLPRSRLRRRRFFSANQMSSDTCTLVSEINAKMKKTGKRRKVDSKITYMQRFKSGNLMITL